MRYQLGRLSIQGVNFSDPDILTQVLELVPDLGRWQWIDFKTGQGQRSGKNKGKAFAVQAMLDVDGFNALAEQSMDCDGFIAALKQSHHSAVDTFAAKARTRVAGTDEAVKLAEYADKATAALAIKADTATPAQVTEAEKEAAQFGKANATEMADLWLERAERLRLCRSTVNEITRNAHAAIDAETEGAALLALGEQLVVDGTQELLSLLES